MMDVKASDVPVGRFFATADRPPGNVFVMRVSAAQRGGEGLCQNIDDKSFWNIEPNRFVRLIREDEYDKTRFHV